MSKTIPCRKVYKFLMEPTELEALELERSALVAGYIYNFGLERCQEYLTDAALRWKQEKNPPP